MNEHQAVQQFGFAKSAGTPDSAGLLSVWSMRSKGGHADTRHLHGHSSAMEDAKVVLLQHAWGLHSQAAACPGGASPPAEAGFHSLLPRLCMVTCRLLGGQPLLLLLLDCSQLLSEGLQPVLVHRRHLQADQTRAAHHPRCCESFWHVMTARRSQHAARAQQPGSRPALSAQPEPAEQQRGSSSDRDALRSCQPLGAWCASRGLPELPPTCHRRGMPAGNVLCRPTQHAAPVGPRWQPGRSHLPPSARGRTGRPGLLHRSHAASWGSLHTTNESCHPAGSGGQGMHVGAPCTAAAELSHSHMGTRGPAVVARGLCTGSFQQAGTACRRQTTPRAISRAASFCNTSLATQGQQSNGRAGGRPSSTKMMLWEVQLTW